MRRRLVTSLLVAVAAATAATGCGATSAATSSSGSLDPKVATAYVDAQAHALCLVQSNAYPTLAALNAAYLQEEHSANMSARQLALAAAVAAHSPALRARLSDRVAALCGKRPAQPSDS